ncbi:ABC transporter substrate-binding protein [Falsiroseomonas ponticola]|uniref:ABC transporter substrate-binding protein n=1 Tax=Falsiroseomonas ponticola TaxID=2786951 RepID=UPI0019346390|nr:ABC transporter substrate-binding protein [Roseomonas ponticola]
MMRLAAALLACALTTPALAQNLTVGMQTEPGTLDPQFNLLGSNTSALRNVYDTLLSRDQNLQVRPSLAESWRAVDGTTWEFKLRPGVRFHDGSPLTADDVKFTIERITRVANNPNSYATYIQGIREVQVVDPLTVRFLTDGPVPLLPTNISNVFIISGAKGVRTTAEFNTGQAAVGTGPYRLSAWQPGQPFVLDRNAEYFAGPAHWQRVTFRPITNDGARVAALLSGDVDFINGVPLQDVARLTQGRTRVFGGASAYVYMLFPEIGKDPLPGVRDAQGNAMPRNPWLDPRVREAMSLAINRDAIVERLMEGRARVANQAVPAGFFGHSDRIPPARFDADRARALLREAGYANGFQTGLACPNDRFVNDSKICEAVAQQLQRVGIRVDLSAQPRATFFPQRARREWPLHAAGWGSLTGESSYFLTSQIHTPNRDLGLGAINYSGISDSEADALIQRGRQILDDGERRRVLEAAMERTIAQNLVIPILTFEAIWAGRADRVRFTPRGDEETLAIEVQPATP